MGERASHVHVTGNTYRGCNFESNCKVMQRRMYDSHMAARVRTATKDGMLRFGPPASGIEQYCSMPRSIWLQGKRAHRPWREIDENVMRSLFLFHEDDAVDCGPLSGLWNRVQREKKAEHGDTASYRSKTASRAELPLTTAPTVEKIETSPSHDIRPLPVDKGHDPDEKGDDPVEGAVTDQAPDLSPDAVNRSDDSKTENEVEIAANEVGIEVGIEEDEDWVMFSDDEAWVIGDSDFEMLTGKNARSCTPSHCP